MRIVCPDSSVFRLQTAAVRRTAHHEGDKRTEEEGEEEEEEKEERSSDEGFMGMTPLLQAHHAMEKMEEFVHKVSHNTHTHCECKSSSVLRSHVFWRPGNLTDEVVAKVM